MHEIALGKKRDFPLLWCRVRNETSESFPPLLRGGSTVMRQLQQFLNRTAENVSTPQGSRESFEHNKGTNCQQKPWEPRKATAGEEEAHRDLLLGWTPGASFIPSLFEPTDCPSRISLPLMFSTKILMLSLAKFQAVLMCQDTGCYLL